MPYLNVEGGIGPEMGKPFAARLCDDGRSRLPVVATIVNEHWIVQSNPGDFRFPTVRHGQSGSSSGVSLTGQNH